MAYVRTRLTFENNETKLQSGDRILFKKHGGIRFSRGEHMSDLIFSTEDGEAFPTGPLEKEHARFIADIIALVSNLNLLPMEEKEMYYIFPLI
jgi:hypothetical protein